MDIYGTRLSVHDMLKHITCGNQYVIGKTVTLYPCLRVGYGINNSAKRMWGIKTHELHPDPYRQQWVWTHYDGICRMSSIMPAQHAHIWSSHEVPTFEPYIDHIQVFVMDLRLLREFQSKAYCSLTQYKANQLYVQLRPLLTAAEKQYIDIARSHYAIGEGRSELDQVCAAIKIYHTKEDVTKASTFVQQYYDRMYNQ